MERFLAFHCRCRVSGSAGHIFFGRAAFTTSEREGRFWEEMAINELQCSTLKQGAFLCWLRKATNRDKDQTYEDNGDSYACSLK